LLFYVDTHFPTINPIFPGIDDIVYKSDINFNFSVSDNLDSILTCNLTVDGIVRHESFNANSGEYTNKTVKGLGIGDHLWNVTCWDNAFNINTSETRNFTIRDLPPVVNLTSPPDNYWFNKSQVVLYYNVTDNNYLNGQFNQSNSTPILNSQINNFTLNLGDGQYNWTINCTDSGGLTNQPSEKIFYVDTIFPSIDLNAPKNNNVSLSENIIFNFTVTDNLDEHLTCNLTINSIIEDENFNADNGILTNRTILDLTDGPKYWNVTCIDDAGNSNTSITWMVNVTVYPTLDLNTQDNESFNHTDITLFYTPADNTNLSNCSLYINGQFNQSNSTPILNSQINNFTLNLGAGIYNWSVVCEDVIGLKNWSENRTFTIDLIEPLIELNYPPPADILYTSQIQFNYTVYDDLDKEIECNLTINGVVRNSTEAQNGSVTSILITFSNGGLIFWNVTCIDDAGNLNVSETRNFTLYLPPIVNLTFPPDNYWFNTSNIVLYYNVTDGNDDIVNSSLILNNQFNQSNSTPILNSQINNFTLTLGDGIYNWTVNVTDKTNLVGTAQQKTFYVDTQKPLIILNYPQHEDIVNDNNVTLNFTVIDNLAKNLTCNVSVDDYNEFENIVVENGTDIIRYISRHDANYTWYVECVDPAGNYNMSEKVNFTVEAPPNITLDYPSPDYRTNSSDITFLYTPRDIYGIIECRLYIDGQLNATDTDIEANQQNSFPVYGIAEGQHNWTVNCTDADYNTAQPEANIFYIDQTPPDVILLAPKNDSGIDYNEDKVWFTWKAVDLLDNALQCNLTVDGVVEKPNIWMTSGISESKSLQTSYLGLGLHYWNVTCWDRVGNTNTSETRVFNLTYPDFMLNLTSIKFNATQPKENETVLVNVTVYNLGGADSYNVEVDLYKGDPDSGGQQIGQEIINISKYSSKTINFTWQATIGPSSIYAIVDPPTSTNGSFDEWNETNNKISKNISVGAWEIFYGNILSTSKKALENNDSFGLLRWSADFKSGNIYVVDYNSNINWNQLKAIGKNTTEGDSSNDFSEIDSVLGMTNFNDSVYNLFTDSGTPKNTTSFRVFGNLISSVPIINSTNNTNFVTGILWDSSDDTNEEYDSNEKEDLIFITEINKNKRGAYGTYDYEIRVPAKLREYKQDDLSHIVFYVEID